MQGFLKNQDSHCHWGLVLHIYWRGLGCFHDGSVPTIIFLSLIKGIVNFRIANMAIANNSQ